MIKIDLSVLLPMGADPHNFEPAPQDVALVSDADLIFTNGAGLESFMTRLLENAVVQTTPVSLSEGLELIPSPKRNLIQEKPKSAMKMATRMYGWTPTTCSTGWTASSRL